MTKMGQDDEYIINTPNLIIKGFKDRLAIIIIFSVIVTWFVFDLLKEYDGIKEIGSYFEKNTYSTQYWVYLQPDSADIKNYRVKGDIDHGEDSYYLNRVYWNNGGYIDFDGCDITDATIKSVGTEKIAAPTCTSGDNSYEVRLGEKVL